MDFRLEGTRRIVNLLIFMLRSLKAEQCDFGGKIAPALEPFQDKVSSLVLLLQNQSSTNSNPFKITQKTAFEAKGRLYMYTSGKVIQRLFIIDLYTQLAIYGYR